MRILVVEDHPATVELLMTVLQRDGHVVASERDGLAGRRRALGESFDLILCDIGLPGLDGLSLAREIRSNHVKVALVALSGHAGEDERHAGIAAGFDGYLTKPISADALLREMAVREAQRPVTPGHRSVAPAVIRQDAAIVPQGRPRGVLGGLVVIAMGLPFVLQPLGVPNAASYLFLAMGGAFGISYARGRAYVYLIPAVTLTSFGIALLLPTWIVMRPETIAPAFVGVVALGFAVAFAVAPNRRWPLVPAVILGAVAAARLVTGVSPIPSPLEPFLVPLVLVGVGAYLLVERQY
jgi:CheY-like chemotaxis protein